MDDGTEVQDYLRADGGPPDTTDALPESAAAAQHGCTAKQAVRKKGEEPRPSRPSGHQRIGDIELLRAVAIILVLIQHVPVLLPWIGVFPTNPFFTYFGFWEGVDLFLAISGFVIARSLMPDLADARDATAYFNAAIAFWVRRMWRLLPSAWLWLAIILIMTVGFNRSGLFGDFRTNFEATVAAILNVANIRTFWVAGRYELGTSFPYWSLSLEEQFYFLLPFLILLSGRRLPLVAGTGVLLQFFLPRSFNPGIPLLLQELRSDALLLGVLIAIWSTHPTYRLFEPEFLKDRPIVGFILFVGLVVLLSVTGSSLFVNFPFRVGLIALISALMVLIASYDKEYFWPTGALKRAMLWLGSRSYALYLVHIPAFLLAREIWYRTQPRGTVFTDGFAVRFAYTGAIFLIVLAELNYRFIEVPLRRRGARTADHIMRRTQFAAKRFPVSDLESDRQVNK